MNQTPAPEEHSPSKIDSSKKLNSGIKRRLKVPDLNPMTLHPGLIPGIGVEKTGLAFPTNWMVFVFALLATASVLTWSIIAPDSVHATGATMLSWVTMHFGWLFGALVFAIFIFMLIVGYGRTGGIRLGADDEEPEYSTRSWISMLFAAGLGIALLFYGPLEPLTHFLNPPPGFGVEAGTTEAILPALAQTILHYGPVAWAIYALVGGTIAYSSFRRGRAPLISSLFEPIFPNSNHRILGRVIDVSAIIVTLFGTAVSLGIGALQIRSGFTFATGISVEGNVFIIGAVSILTALFIASAVSGVKKGIRLLSNMNMLFVGLIGAFVLVTGPTLFILNTYSASIITFFSELGTMLSMNPTQGEPTADFLATWTTFYWAWWISWSPFVGMFIAKISRGRTLREFVTVVVLVPAIITTTWFMIFGSTAISFTLDGVDLIGSGAGEEVLFGILGNLPFGTITSIIAMIAVIIFFVTAADSASIVMASMSQSGRPEPAKWVTVVWGLMLGSNGLFLLIAGGQQALTGLQSMMVVTALPFAFVIIGVMIAWSKDLATDPYIIRRKYARAAIAQGVRRGIDEYGDDFVFGTDRVPEDEGAGAGFDSDDPALTEWYIEAASDSEEQVRSVDVQRTLEPGRIQQKGPERPDHTASGDASLTVGEEAREVKRQKKKEE